MPYVDGESLRDRLRREKQLPIPDAVRIATETASALDYAHRHGVIHRDIKPENILLHDGQALVADFGIALAVSQVSGTRMTETGMSLGTPHYMSPEQAMGEREITARSDVYALGCVTYEMLTGEPPFTGPTAQAIVAKMMTEPARRLISQRHTIPAPVEDAVLTALEKLPADRFATAAEFSAALTSSEPRSGTTIRLRASSRRRIPTWLVAAPVALVLAGAGLVWSRDLGPAPPVRTFSIVLPDSAPLEFVGAIPLLSGLTELALSPDGRRIAYSGGYGRGVRLYVRALDGFDVTPLEGTDGAYLPFFSSDGQSIGFFVDDQLKRIPVGGGGVVNIARLRFPYGAAWPSGDRILVAHNFGYSASWVRVTDRVATPISSDGQVPLFDLLPGGKSVVASGWSQNVTVVTLATGKHLMLTRSGPVTVSDSFRLVSDRIIGSTPRFAGDHLFWLRRDGTLMAAGFDPGSFKFTGPAVEIVSGLRREATAGAAHYAISAHGDLLYVAGSDADVGVLAFVDSGGRTDTLPLPAQDYLEFDLSPDGRRLAVIIRAQDQSTALWLMDLGKRAVAVRLSPAEADVAAPRWTPDGRSLLYSITSRRTGKRYNLRQEPDRSTPDTLQAAGDYPAVAPDQAQILTADASDSLVGRLWLTPFRSGEPAHLVEAAPLRRQELAFSPDGRWLASLGGEKDNQIYVEPWPLTGERYQLSGNFGTEPVWSPRGTGLFYREGRKIMFVPLTADRAHPFGSAHVFVEGEFSDFVERTFAATADGKRLIVKLGPEEHSSREIRVITNVFALIAQRERAAAAR
jgi:serine/threonine-protein kinase